MIEHEDVQQKLHAELDDVIGSERMICVSDRQSLPYTNAVMMEIQRLANLVSQNIFRRTTKDVVIEGFPIEKGTMIVPQISVMAIDPEVGDFRC